MSATRQLGTAILIYMATLYSGTLSSYIYLTKYTGSKALISQSIQSHLIFYHFGTILPSSASTSTEMEDEMAVFSINPATHPAP